MPPFSVPAVSFCSKSEGFRLRLQGACLHAHSFPRTVSTRPPVEPRLSAVGCPEDLAQAIAAIAERAPPFHFTRAPKHWLAEKIKAAAAKLNDSERRTLIDYGVLDGDLDLTENGHTLLRRFAREFHPDNS